MGDKDMAADSEASRNLSAASAKARVPAGAISRGAGFALGGLAGMAATVFVQPLDLLKNRMQLSGEGGKSRDHRTSFHAILKIVRSEGVFGMYNGLSAGLLRQATYSTTRLGVYQSLQDKFTLPDGTPPPLWKKLIMGLVAGSCGAVVGTPAEVSLIRMTSDGRLPVDQRRGYKSVFDALFRITREEGLLTLWRGCGPTVVRAMVVNAVQLTTYSQVKQFLLSTAYFKDDIKCHFAASMTSGLFTTIASMPVDISKTRIQTMKIVNGVPEYTGALDVLVKLIRKEGFFSLWKGFTPYYARLGPHTVLTFIFLEKFRLWYYMFKQGGAPP